MLIGSVLAIDQEARGEPTNTPKTAFNSGKTEIIWGCF